jgi:hypothetical protein
MGCPSVIISNAERRLNNVILRGRRPQYIEKLLSLIEPDDIHGRSFYRRSSDRAFGDAGRQSVVRVTSLAWDREHVRMVSCSGGVPLSTDIKSL